MKKRLILIIACFILLVSTSLAACVETTESQAEQDSSAEQSALSESKEESAEESCLPETTEESEPETSVDPSEELVHVAPDFDWDSVEEWDGEGTVSLPVGANYYGAFQYSRYMSWYENPDHLTWVRIIICEAKEFGRAPDDAETIDERSSFAKRFLADAGRPFVSQKREYDRHYSNGTTETLSLLEIWAPLSYNEIKLFGEHGGYIFDICYSPRNEKSEWYGTIN